MAINKFFLWKAENAIRGRKSRAECLPPEIRIGKEYGFIVQGSEKYYKGQRITVFSMSEPNESMTTKRVGEAVIIEVETKRDTTKGFTHSGRYEFTRLD